MRTEDFAKAAKLFSQSDLPPHRVIQEFFKKSQQFEQEDSNASSSLKQTSQKFDKESEMSQLYGSLRLTLFEKKEKLNAAILLFLDSVLFDSTVDFTKKKHTSHNKSNKRKNRKCERDYKTCLSEYLSLLKALKQYVFL
jgi:hypothetical protein